MKINVAQAQESNRTVAAQCHSREYIYRLAKRLWREGRSYVLISGAHLRIANVLEHSFELKRGHIVFVATQRSAS